MGTLGKKYRHFYPTKLQTKLKTNTMVLFVKIKNIKSL
jgi:hypothetical protein